MYDDSTTLVARLEERKRQADEQARNSAATAQGSTSLSGQSEKTQAAISESQTASKETSNSVDASKSAAESFSKDFDDYRAVAEDKIRSGKSKAALWRGLALSAGSALAGRLIDPSSPRGALVGAGIGAAGGAAWGVVDIWPWRVLP